MKLKLNDRILKLINTTWGQLGYALLAGLGYFALVAGVILDLSRGMWLILMYVAPLIVCGAALVIIKLIKQARENENDGAILRIFWVHIAVIALGIVFAVSLFA